MAGMSEQVHVLSNRGSRAVMLILGTAMTGMGVLILLVGDKMTSSDGAPMPPVFKWLLAITIIALGLPLFVLAFRVMKEKTPAEVDFVELVDGRAQVGSPLVRELAERTAGKLAGTPWQVFTTDDAVHVRFDAGAYYTSLGLPFAHLTTWGTTLVHAGGRTFTRIDGEATFDASLKTVRYTATRGRSIKLSWHKEVAVGADGVATPVDYAYDSRIPTRAIKDTLAEMDLREGWDASSMAGAIAGFGTLAAMVIAGIVALVMWATGQLG